MKRLNTGFAIVLMLLFTNTFGQTVTSDYEKGDKEYRSAQTYLDIMVNVVSTNINYGGSNSDVADYKKSQRGIQAGASFQAGITHKFSIVPEIYFIRKGGKLKANNPLTANESSLHLNTLEFPVLARFHMGRFYINAGPSLAYNFSGKQKINNQPSKLLFNNTSEGFKRFDAGIQMGGGFEFPLKQRRIALDIRYAHGLTNIAYGKEIYNRALMISVHFSKRWKTSPLAKK